MATDVQIATHKVVSVNPATGHKLHEFESATEEHVRAAVARARAAQVDWSEIGVQRRISLLRKFQQLLHARKSEVARVITTEAGKPLVEALLTEVMVVLDAARFCIDNVYAFLREQPVPHGSLAMKTKIGRIERQPYGVVGIISPWNYPFSIPATETLAALAVGNAVVLKPSEFTSLAALELASLLHAAGVPQDVFQVIVGDGTTGGALIHADIDKLTFTGSVADRKAHCASCGDSTASAGPRAGRQGPHAGPRRRRCRRCFQRRGLGSIRECGAGLPFHRALLCASQFVPEVSGRLRGEDQEAARGRRP